MKKSEIKIGALLSYLTFGLSAVIGLFYSPFLTRCLGQAEFGLYSLIGAATSYMLILDFGFGNAVVVYTSKYLAKGDKEGMQKLHGMFFIIFIIISIITLLIGTILCLNLDSIFAAKMSTAEIYTAKILLMTITIGTAAGFPFFIYSNSVIAFEKFVFSKTVNLIRTVSIPLCSIPFVLWSYKSVALTIIATIINFTCLFINFVYAKNKIKLKLNFSSFNSKIFWGIAGYAFFIFLNQIVDNVNWFVDNFILGATCGTAAVALYSVAANFNILYLNFSQTINSVLLPSISKKETKHASDKEFTDIFVSTGRIQFIVIGLVITGFVIFGKQFIEILYGPDYHTSYIIACILMLGCTIPLIQNVGISILQAKNMFRFRAILWVVLAVWNIFISIVLSKQFGGIGAAIGTASSFLIGDIIIMNFYYHLKVKINIWKFWLNFIKQAVPIAVIFIFTYFIHAAIGTQGILVFILEIIVYTLIYVFITYTFAMNVKEKELFKKPLKRFFTKKHGNN